MAIAQRYIGEDIYFSIKKRKADLSYQDLDAYTDIFVYASNGANTIKFSKNVKTGYTQLIRISSTEYAAILTSANTTTLDIGHVKISTDFIEISANPDLRTNKKSVDTVIYLSQNPINPER